MMKRFISIILTVFLVYISTISVMANDATDFYQKNSNCKNYSYSSGNDSENEYINIDNKELLVNGMVKTLLVMQKCLWQDIGGIHHLMHHHI